MRSRISSFVIFSAFVFLVTNVRAERVVLTTDEATCVVETKGARLMSFKPKGGEEVLWQDAPEQLEAAQWAHGGIPVCWPWFGRAGDGDNYIHGLAWRREFAIAQKQIGAQCASLTLKLTTASAELIYRAILSKAELTLELETINITQDPLVFSAAFHSYFRVTERDDCRLYCVPGHKQFPLDRAVDEVIQFPTAIPKQQYRLFDVKGGRILQITAWNSSGVNIWNPGEAMECPGTITGDGWRHFIAVEPMARGEGRFEVIEKGAHHKLGMSISVHKAGRL